jgi:hypothetical protein
MRIVRMSLGCLCPARWRFLPSSTWVCRHCGAPSIHTSSTAHKTSSRLSERSLRSVGDDVLTSPRFAHLGGICFSRTQVSYERRAHCQERPSPQKPRRVRAVFWPPMGSAPTPSPPVKDTPSLSLPPPPHPTLPLLMQEWPRCHLRRTWLTLLRCETVACSLGNAPPSQPVASSSEPAMTRAARAQRRLRWKQRFARHARLSTSVPVPGCRPVVLEHGLCSPQPLFQRMISSVMHISESGSLLPCPVSFLRFPGAFVP